MYGYRLRHTFATEFLRRNPGEIEQFRLILGHADYSVIQRYDHLVAQDLAAGWDQKAPFGRVR